MSIQPKGTARYDLDMINTHTEMSHVSTAAASRPPTVESEPEDKASESDGWTKIEPGPWPKLSPITRKYKLNQDSDLSSDWDTTPRESD